LSRELGNCELFWLVENESPDYSSELSIENAGLRYLAKQSFGGDFDEEIGFIASHFSSFRNIDNFDVSDLEMIISNSSLHISSEDFLFDLICERGFLEHFRLFEYVEFEFISPDRIRQFVDQVEKLDIAPNSLVLQKLYKRLVLPVDTRSLKRGRSRRCEDCRRICFFPDSDPLDGIISHLARQCGGNVHEQNVVIVTSSPTYSNEASRAANNAADLRNDSLFYSHYRPSSSDIPHTRNNWICYNFKERTVIPSHYVVRSRNDEWGRPGSFNLKSWVVETSLDGTNWIEIDHKESNSQLDDKNVIATFEVSRREECHFLRLVNIGRNHAFNDAVVISGLEIFGALIEPE
jgi:hypothetical protein